MQVVLSVFSGIDILGKGFEKEGFCVVSAMDIIFGHDIRDKHFPSGVFKGLIGGSPCQDFSRARRTPPTGYGLEMLQEFERVVQEVKPDWFLLENVPSVPNLNTEGYYIQRFDLNARECGSEQNRLRHFQFGSKQGFILDIKRDDFKGRSVPCVVATEGNKQDRRTWSDFCQLQGLPADFDLKCFTQIEKYKAVGNAVNFNVAGRVAKAIREITEGNNTRKFTDTKICMCGCGRVLRGKQKTANDACRKRLQKKRERSGIL